MKAPIKKVITASAGTGKTYRLSLEYIHLLLLYREYNIGFDEILVITFTRKATSEIRTAIVEHLQDLLSRNAKGVILQESLLQLFGIEIADPERAYLQKVYEQMLVNKHKMQVSTIDSFVHSIFKAVIAPYIGITSFQIDNEINARYLPRLYNHIFADSTDAESFIKIFRTAGKHSIEQYDNLILSIIDNRWLLQMISDQEIKLSPEERADLAAKVLKEFQDGCDRVMDQLREHFDERQTDDERMGYPVDKYVRKEYLKLLRSESLDSYIRDFTHMIRNEEFLAENWNLLSKDLRFWNSKKIKGSEVKDRLNEEIEIVRQYFAHYLFYRYLLEEENEILTLADHILQEYDRLKMQDKIFTHSDIAFYTFKYMYEPELSLIDPINGSVSNRFYEYLASRTRFILIDEFQDTGIVQHKLLFPIISEIISGAGSKEYGGVIVVGDEKQSIYGWRSGERDLLLKMPEIIQTNDSASLSTTYRSSRFIIDFINRIFGDVSRRLQDHDQNWQYGGNILSGTAREEGYLGCFFYNASKIVISTENGDNSDPYRTFVETTLLPLYERKQINPADSVVLARNNKHLYEIARVLEEYGIDYFLESSYSFLQHQTIKPLIHLLRYISEQDILHLLRFLRSDYSLIPAQDLKKIALLRKRSQDTGKSIPELLKEEFSSNLIISKTVKVIEQYNSSDLIGFIAEALREFNVTGLFPEEHNIKNIHLFLDFVARFFIRKGIDYPKNVTGLLQFLQDNEKNEELRQASIDNIDSLQLMTIHKAKGLGFDHVFFYYETSIRAGQPAGQLQYLYRFNDLFTDLEECRISYNYSRVLDDMNYQLKVKQDQRDMLEELNNIYVALTRARTKISLFAVFENKDGLLAAADTSSEDPTGGPKFVRKIFLETIVNYLNNERDNGLEQEVVTPALSRYEFGSLPVIDLAEKLSEKDSTDYGIFVSLKRSELLEQPEFKDDIHLNYKTVYLTNRQVVFGDLAHYYLSFIRYGEEEELTYAEKRTRELYGNLIPLEIIDSIIEKTNSFIRAHTDIFNRDWDLVYNEKTIFDKYQKEYRIDRVMIDKKNRRILLIDYKTGSLKDKEQLKRYEKIVADFSEAAEKNYTIETRYLEVKIT